MIEENLKYEDNLKNKDNLNPTKGQLGGLVLEPKIRKTHSQLRMKLNLCLVISYFAPKYLSHLWFDFCMIAIKLNNLHAQSEKYCFGK